MTRNNQPPRGPFVGCFVAAILLAPIAYVLSTGPVVWLFDHGYIPGWIGLFYQPLEWLCAYVPAFERFFDWYFKLWGR